MEAYTVLISNGPQQVELKCGRAPENCAGWLRHKGIVLLNAAADGS
jgi:hypothetical protein